MSVLFSSSRWRSLRAAAVVAAIYCLAAAPVAAADPVALQLTIKDHRFEPAELKAPAGRPILITVKNLDGTAEEFESKALKIEKVVAGKGEAVIRIRELTPGRYPFVGEYNESTAKGVLVVE